MTITNWSSFDTYTQACDYVDACIMHVGQASPCSQMAVWKMKLMYLFQFQLALKWKTCSRSENSNDERVQNIFLFLRDGIYVRDSNNKMAILQCAGSSRKTMRSCSNVNIQRRLYHFTFNIKHKKKTKNIYRSFYELLLDMRPNDECQLRFVTEIHSMYFFNAIKIQISKVIEKKLCV